MDVRAPQNDPKKSRVTKANPNHKTTKEPHQEPQWGGRYPQSGGTPEGVIWAPKTRPKPIQKASQNEATPKIKIDFRYPPRVVVHEVGLVVWARIAPWGGAPGEPGPPFPGPQAPSPPRSKLQMVSPVSCQCESICV